MFDLTVLSDYLNKSVFIVDSVAATGKIGESVAPVITESMCRLSGHSNRVTCVAWSCHRSGLLASASYDYTVQVLYFFSSIIVEFNMIVLFR